MKLISIIVPMYNEESVIPIFFSTLNDVLTSLPQYRFEIIVVNDGSKDQTLSLLLDQQKKQANLVIVNLSRNFGHEPAVAAGIYSSKGDALIPMDADLQDPPTLIQAMLTQFEQGYEVVNAKRRRRHEDSFFKRFTAIKFYQWIAKLSGKITIPQNVGHFRLISRRVADRVIQLSERNRVFRIQVPFVGFKTTTVEFDRPKRAAGQTHYNFKSMVKLAIDAFTSTTGAPLMWPFTIAVLWGGLTVTSIIVMVTLFSLTLLTETMFMIWLVANVLSIGLTLILLILALMSLYLSRVFIETQNRPFFVIDKVYDVKS
jgi:glycosyltransferase involved in cell wall biosynthesis